MKIVTGKTGTPHVTSRQFRGMMEGIIGQDSYIITHGENLEPELVTNNKLKIKSGMMCHHGNISTVEIGTYDEVTIQNGTQGMKRIDLIVNRYSKVEGTGIEENNWVVIQGTPGAEDPVAPAYTEGNLQEGDLVDDCPVFEAHLDGINVTEIKKLLIVSPSINPDLVETVYDRSALPIADFYDVTDFDLRKRGNEVFFNVSLSMRPGAQFDPNTLYSIGPSPMLSELRPQKVYFLSGYGCDSNWGNPTPISTFVDTAGYVRYCASARKTYFKISGHWVTE